MRKIIFCTIILVLWTGVAGAQTQTSEEINKKEFFAGYSENVPAYLGGDSEDRLTVAANPKTFRGWNASAVYNLNRYVGVKADISGHYRNLTFAESPVRVRGNFSYYNFLGGVQLKDNKKSKRFAPFAHALIGAGFSKGKLNASYLDFSLNDSAKGFAMAFGGGVDLKVKKNFSVRLIQLDYNPVIYSGFREHRIRAGFGIVLH